MPSTNLIKRDWEKDHVYLIQFPRAGGIVSPSPYALKLETWLRVAQIPYTNISNEMKIMSNRGQIPFIELNGRQHADSSQIIEALTTHFNKQPLDITVPHEKAIARAFYALIEHHLIWIAIYSRGQDFSWLASVETGYGRVVTGAKAFLFKKIFLKSFEKKIKNRVAGQGIGTLTKEEIIEQAKKDIDALSIQLADKDYLFGSEIKTIDATLFGHFAQFLYTPLFSPEIKAYIESNAQNLIRYIDRIKAQYWPDWDETIATQDMNINTKKE